VHTLQRIRSIPLPIRIALSIPGIRRLPAHVIGYGVRAPRLEAHATDGVSPVAQADAAGP